MKIPETEYTRLNMMYNDTKHHNTKLRITNLPLKVTEQDIRQLFGKYGTILRLNIKQGITQTATIKYMRTEQTLLARKELNNYLFPFTDQKIEVTLSNHKPGKIIESQVQIPYAAEIPLIMLYVEYMTSEGKPYFYNVTDKTSQWERPAEYVRIVKAPPPANRNNKPREKQGIHKRGPPGSNLFIFHLPNEWSNFTE